ncbi:MAG: DeoR/GlpR transcriptional regulator [Hyphomicrobiales bacterium]|nr:DeoR/GlpR transcriptional regulator [Hyphomicrobiales bacterium]
MANVDKFSSRQESILKQIKGHGSVHVENLAEEFATTPQTIRKDLQILADANRIMRFHGGASLLTGLEYTDFEIRRKISPRQKEAIGKTVANRIPNNIALMINAGTTTLAVSRELKHHTGLKIVTDNVSIANEIRLFEGVEVMVPAGTVRRSDGAILGETAVDFIRMFRADIGIIGAAAISSDGALLDYDLREANVAREIIKNSHHVILAADSSKFHGSGTVQIGHISQVDTLVTDQCQNSSISDLCQMHNVELVLAMRKDIA